jgi:hypothetical protein
MDVILIFIFASVIFLVVGLITYSIFYKNYYNIFLLALEQELNSYTRATIIEKILSETGFVVYLSDLDTEGQYAFNTMKSYTKYMYPFQKLYTYKLFNIALDFIENKNLLGYNFIYLFSKAEADPTVLYLCYLAGQIDPEDQENIELEIENEDVIEFKRQYMLLLRAMTRVLLYENYINSNNYQDLLEDEVIEITLTNFFTDEEIEYINYVDEHENDETINLLKYETMMDELLMLFLVKLGLNPESLYDSEYRSTKEKKITFSDNKLKIFL